MKVTTLEINSPNFSIKFLHCRHWVSKIWWYSRQEVFYEKLLAKDFAKSIRKIYWNLFLNNVSTWNLKKKKKLQAVTFLFNFNGEKTQVLVYSCYSPSLNFGSSWIWSTWDIPSRFVIKILTRVRSETSYDQSWLPTRFDRGQGQMKNGIKNWYLLNV